MLCRGLGTGPGNASPRARSRACDHRSNFKPFARPVWLRMANRSIPPLLWTRFGLWRCSVNVVLINYAYLSNFISIIVFPHFLRYSRFQSWIPTRGCTQCFEGLRLSQAEHGSWPRYIMWIAIRQILRQSLVDWRTAWQRQELHRPKSSWWESLGQVHLTNSCNMIRWWLWDTMIYFYVLCCCSCRFFAQCRTSIVCRWISGATTRAISLHLLVLILVPPGMHWSSPMIMPCFPRSFPQRLPCGYNGQVSLFTILRGPNPSLRLRSIPRTS